MPSSTAARLLLAGFCSAAWSCGATALAPLDPLEILSQPEFDFAASVGAPAAAWESVLGASPTPHIELVRISQASSLRGAPDPSFQPPKPLLLDELMNDVVQSRDPAASAGPSISVRCTNLILSPEEADVYLGWQPGATQALIANRRELEHRLDNLASALPRSIQNDVTLHLVPDQVGRMTEVTQSAFVQDYSLGVPGGLALVGDPNIGVLGEGFSLALWAGAPSPQGISLRVDLASAEIQQSHRESEFRLPSGSSLSLQQPLALAQNLRTACTLDTDQALLLVTLGRENSHQLLFTVLRAQPYGSS